jgi:hypothetical protein
MIEPGSPAFPTANHDDDDDVAWALSTAQVQWKRGSRADAVVWLRRAIDSAVSVGATWRAAELTRQTDALEAKLAAGHAVHQGDVAVEDDYDGSELIDTEATSLPPDAEMDDIEELLSGDSTDERTDVTPEDEQPLARRSELDAEEIELEPDDMVMELAEDDLDGELAEEDIVEADLEEDADLEVAEEIADVEVVEDDAEEIADDELGELSAANEGAGPRFGSEPPTDVFNARGPFGAMSEDEPPDTVSERPPETEPEPEPAPRGTGPIPASAERAPLAAELTMPVLSGISLSEVRGFEDFPPETQLALARAAKVERLAKDEEVSGFGLALVLRGSVKVMPTIADTTCGLAGERELVYGRGSLDEGVALRLVASGADTEVAVWDFGSIEPALSDCPWVREELQTVADNYQALAGVSMGPMGDRLDDMLRGLVLARCKLVRLLPGEVLVEKGKAVTGLFIVGAGRIELGSDAETSGSEGQLGPGEFLFAQTILAGGKAPTGARAGASGALLMAAGRHDAHELMVSVPPLLELLAG